MTSTKATATTASPPDRRQGLSELLVPVLLLGIGAAVLVDASGLEEGLGRSGPVGPKAIPYAIGAALVVGALWLAVDVLRGGRGEPESGEDVDLSHGSDWPTLAIMFGAFLANVLLIERAGWPVSGAVLFFGCAYALGSRKVVRDLVLSFALSIGSWYLFVLGLDIDLPVGVLNGIL
jgi:putative tricarboxylic transport membrane protein